MHLMHKLVVTNLYNMFVQLRTLPPTSNVTLANANIPLFYPKNDSEKRED